MQSPQFLPVESNLTTGVCNAKPLQLELGPTCAQRKPRVEIASSLRKNKPTENGERAGTASLSRK